MHTGADSATSSVSGAVHSVSDTARQRTEGNPLAVGLVAFGAGLVAATLFPATRREEALAERAQPRLEDAATKMAPAAQQVVEELKPAATDAVEELKDEAKEAAQNVTGEAKDKAKETAASARSAASSAKGS
jgi:gas vesicle protein